MTNGNIYKPMCERPPAESKWSRAKLEDRKERFATLNKFVTERGGWIVSIPGDRDVRVEVLENSSLPEEMSQLGYKLEPDGEGERILPHAITTQVVSDVDGVLTPVTEGSSGRPVITVTHAGIARVLKFTLTLP